MVTNSQTTQHVITQSKMLPNRDHVGIRPDGAIGPGAHLTEGIVAMQPTNTSQHKQLDVAAPEFYPEGTIGGSTTAKDTPRMMVTLTLETCLAKVTQKQDTSKGDLYRTYTTTRNSQQVPGQTNRYNRSEQRLEHKRGTPSRKYVLDEHTPTHQGGSSITRRTWNHPMGQAELILKMR